jgi:hypothetical protein
MFALLDEPLFAPPARRRRRLREALARFRRAR